MLALSGCGKDQTGPGDDSPAATPDGEKARFAGCTAEGTNDTFDDGSIDQRFYREYSDLGSPTLVEEFTADGELTYRWSATVDELDNPLDETLDEDGDGVIDYRLVSEYDPDGNLVRFEEDSNGDGQVDVTGTYEIVDGLARSARWDWVDPVQIDSDLEFTYDDLGRLLNIRRFQADTTRLQTIDLYTWHLDRHQLATWDYEYIAPRSGPPYDQGESRLYDDQHRVVGLRTYYRPGGLEESEYTYVYDDEAPQWAWSEVDATHRTEGEVVGTYVAEVTYDAGWRPELYVIAAEGSYYVSNRQVVDWSCP